MCADRQIRAVICVATFALGVAAAGGTALAAPKAVLENFTSQGCSSCPPADKLLGAFARDRDVIALSFSVDIWDYRGWKDTLATHENTERQRDYAAKRGDSQVYTPQMVINGVAHVAGSDEHAIKQAIADAELAGGLPVPVSITLSDQAVNIDVGAAGGPWPLRGTLWLVLFDSAKSVRIDRGENQGRTVTYYNVVRKMQRLQMWKGAPLSLSLPEAELYESGADGCVVLLQTEATGGRPGTIVGAAQAIRNSYYGRP